MPVVELHCLRLEVPELDPDSRAELEQGTWEQDETRLALACFAPGDRVLQAGGGIGYLAARLALARTDVVSYEPDPDLHACASRNLASAAPSARLLHGALVRTGRQTRFYRERWARAGNILRDAGLGTMDVPAFPFPDELARWRPTALALDVEGMETELLVDPTADLASVRALVVEWHLSMADPAPARRRLLAEGFRLRERLAKTRLPLVVEAWTRPGGAAIS